MLEPAEKIGNEGVSHPVEIDPSGLPVAEGSDEDIAYYALPRKSAIHRILRTISRTVAGENTVGKLLEQVKRIGVIFLPFGRPIKKITDLVGDQLKTKHKSNNNISHIASLIIILLTACFGDQSLHTQPMFDFNILSIIIIVALVILHYIVSHIQKKGIVKAIFVDVEGLVSSIQQYRSKESDGGVKITKKERLLILEELERDGAVILKQLAVKYLPKSVTSALFGQ